MRNLKKVLSLALALVMLLGMMVVGAGATEFRDDSSIEYKEAADVLSALNVIVGRNGNFEPKAALTRAEGAAIVYRMLTSGTSANPVGGATGFVDVDNDPSFAWATGIIADLASKGIISGVDATHFAPGDPLIGAAFGKMLLVALGYNPEYQGYTGGGWDGNVIRDCYSNGLSVSGVVMSNVITREQAAQMALNTLQAPMVYQKGGIQIGDVVIPGDRAEKIEGTGTASKDFRASATDDAFMEFCEAYFPTLKLSTADADDFGRPGGNKWTYNDKTVFSGAKSVSYSIVVNQVGHDTNYWANKANKGLSTTGAVISKNGADSATNASVGNLTIGSEVEFFNVTDNVAGKVVVTEYSVGKITTLTTNKDGDVRYYVTAEAGYTNASGTDFASASTADTVVVEGTVEKGDYVTYAEANDVLYIYPTTSFEGVQQSFKLSSRTINVDGSSYTVFGNISMSNFPNSTDSATFYLDKNEFAVKSEAVAQSKDYAIIDSIALQTSGDGLTTSQGVKAILVFPDGTSKTVEVSSINGLSTSDSTKVAAVTTPGTHYANAQTDTNGKIEKLYLSTVNKTAATATDNVALNGAIVTYDENDGKYALTFKNVTVSANEAGNAGATSTNIVLANSTGANNLANTDYITTKGVNNVAYAKSGSLTTATTTTSTKYVVKTAAGKWSAYTGFREVPSIKADTASKVFCNIESGKATLVYIDLSAASNGGTVQGDEGRILFVTGSKPVTFGTDERVFSAIVDGKVDDVRTKESAVVNTLTSDASKGKLLELTEKDGYITDAVPASSYTDSVLTSNVNVDEKTVGAYVYGDDVTAYVIENYELTEDGIEAAEVGDTIYVKTKGATGVAGVTVDTIYIVKGMATTFNTQTPDVDAVQKNLDSGDKKVTLDASGTITLNDDLTVPSGATLTIEKTVTGTGKIILGGGTVNLGSAVTTLPTITGKGSVDIQGTIATSDTLDILSSKIGNAEQRKAVNRDATKPVSVTIKNDGAALTGSGSLEAWWAGKSINDLIKISDPNGTSVSLFKVTLTGLQNGDKVTGEKCVNGEWVSLNGDLATDAGVEVSGKTHDVLLLLADTVSEVRFTVTPHA